MLHRKLDEAFFLGQEHVVSARVGIQGLGGPTNSYGNSIPTTFSL